MHGNLKHGQNGSTDQQGKNKYGKIGNSILTSQDIQNQSKGNKNLNTIGTTSKIF